MRRRRLRGWLSGFDQVARYALAMCCVSCNASATERDDAHRLAHLVHPRSTRGAVRFIIVNSGLRDVRGYVTLVMNREVDASSSPIATPR